MKGRRYCLLLVVIIIAQLGNAFNFFNGNNGANGPSACDWRGCHDTYVTQTTPSDITNVYRCLYIVQALQCLNDELPNCIGESRLDLNSAKHEIDRDFYTHNCSQYSNPTPTISQSSTTVVKPTFTPSACASKLPQKIISTQSAPNGHYKPGLSLVNALCTPHSHHALRQCSIYFDSHAQQFNGSFQTCTLPGSWYLLHHPDVTIEVTGGTRNTSSVFTNINKINITLNSKLCTFGAVFNYVAKTGETLPSSLYSSNPSVKALYQPLEFHLDSTKTTASILAPWLNLTVIIRKHDDYLSVVLRMPADLAHQSEGICRSGCSSHTRYDIVKQTSYYCPSDQLNATRACAYDAGLISSRLPAELITNLIQTCLIDILRTNSYDTILLYKGIAKDYLALPSVGVHIVPEPNANIINVQTSSTTLIMRPSSSANSIYISSSSSSLSSNIITSTSSFYTSSIISTPSPVANTPQPNNEVTDGLHSSSSALTLTSSILILCTCLCINFL